MIDSIVDISFKEIPEGGFVYYPWGIMYCGYIIPDDVRYRDTRKKVKISYLFLLIASIFTGTFANFEMWTVVVILVMSTLSYYIVTVRILVRGLQKFKK